MKKSKGIKKKEAEKATSHKDEKNLDESFIEVFLASTQYNYVNFYINFSLFFYKHYFQHISSYCYIKQHKITRSINPRLLL